MLSAELTPVIRRIMPTIVSLHLKPSFSLCTSARLERSQRDRISAPLSHGEWFSFAINLRPRHIEIWVQYSTAWVQLGAHQVFEAQWPFFARGWVMNEHKPDLFQDVEVEKLVDRIIRAWRSRRDLPGSDLFSDPAWDMLLALFLAELKQHRVTTSQLIKATTVSNTSALRWLNALEQRGLIIRRRAPLDGRSFFVELTDSVSRALREWARSIAFAGPNPLSFRDPT
jgi:DNA-binding MarR family transcriptional regulator